MREDHGRLVELQMAGGEPHNSRAPQPRGGCIPTWGDRNGAIADSLVLVSRRKSGRSWLDSGRVGTGVQPLQGEIYTYNRVLGHVHFPTLLLLHLE